MPTLEIQIYDGRRRPFLAGNVLVYVRKKFEGKNLVAKYVDSDRLDVNFDDNPGELVVIAARDGFHQCGVFVKDLSRPVSLMLVHKAENIEFDSNFYGKLIQTETPYAKLIGSDPDAKKHLDALRTFEPKSLACLLNVLEAIRWLPNAKEVIATLESIVLQPRRGGVDWRGVQEDRIFVTADSRLPGRLREESFVPALFGGHPGADAGFKESGRFREANLNFSLNTKSAGPGKVLADIDLDYFDDKLAHVVLEVIPNEASKITGKRKFTNPVKIYAYRWMATRNCDKPLSRYRGGSADSQDFDPMFVVGGS